MALHLAYYTLSFSPREGNTAGITKYRPLMKRCRPSVLSVNCRAPPSYNNSLVSEVVRLLIPPARFEASKLKVNLRVEEPNKYSAFIPRTYILSHCDFTANLTLTISTVISMEQLKGWYSRDDVVAEWKQVNEEMCLHVHCFVSGPNPLLNIAAELRYHIFSKELPLVLQAVLHGDTVLFNEHPELMDAVVRVYFHSSSPKYNLMECWGPLKDAAQVKNIYDPQLNNLCVWEGGKKGKGRTEPSIVNWKEDREPEVYITSSIYLPSVKKLYR